MQANATTESGAGAQSLTESGRSREISCPALPKTLFACWSDGLTPPAISLLVSTQAGRLNSGARNFCPHVRRALELFPPTRFRQQFVVTAAPTSQDTLTSTIPSATTIPAG